MKKKITFMWKPKLGFDVCQFNLHFVYANHKTPNKRPCLQWRCPQESLDERINILIREKRGRAEVKTFWACFSQ